MSEYITPKIEDLRYGQTLEYNQGTTYWRDGEMILSFDVDRWKEVVYDRTFVDRGYLEYWLTNDLIDNSKLIRIKKV